MEEREYLEALCRAAGRFLAQAGPGEVRRRLRAEGDLSGLEKELHPRVQEVLASAGRLEDILKHARFREPEPSVWRDASSWSEAVFRAAYLMVLEDLKDLLRRAAEGRLPAAALGGERS